jgi:hypothetical protein
MSKTCPEGETVREHYAHGGHLFDDDLTTPEHLLHGSRIEQLRVQVPVLAEKLTQLVVDNPAQFALLFAGGIVLGRVAGRMVRPRTALEGLALMTVLQAGVPLLATQAIERGWIRFKVRDEDGQLVPLIPGKALRDAAPE